MDANVFASLALLNKPWRRISESPALYAHHLSQCQSHAWTKGTALNLGETTDLESLKRQFIEEIRRNAFDVFLRPRQTLVRLTSSSMSSSTAFPQGEVFRFVFSGKGQTLLCITSSRIVVLDLAADPVAVKHELQTRRRPTGAAIVDDGSLLAVLSSTHRVNIYRLSKDEARYVQTIMLNDAPRGLTFSPSGSVLALSFDDSIEVHAVGEQTQPTERRAARCLRVNSLSFSSDGTMLLGSPVDHADDGVVSITAPFYTETAIDASPDEVQMRMWTAQILFGETTPGFTLACLLDGHEAADSSWILGYDNRLLAFRAMKLNNANASSVYFVSPFLAEESREKLPITLPSTDERGELAAFGFQDSEVWIYGIPKRLHVASSNTNPDVQESAQIGIGGAHHDRHTAPRDNLAQLQKIVQQPALLVRGCRVAHMHGITAVRWVKLSTSKSPRRRLAAVAPGGVHPQIFGGEDAPVDGGRVLLLDFERAINNGEMTELDIEVGETTPIMLVEPDSSMDTEVELERRRTRLRRPDTDSTLAHGTRRHLPRGTQRANQTFLQQSRHSVAIPTFTDGVSGDAANDIPYDNTQPRSGDTLQRAATAAASTRGRHNPRYRNSPSRQRVRQNRDADGWVAPPPPYSRESKVLLPDHLRQSLLPKVPVTTQARSPPAQPVPVQREQIPRRALSVLPGQPRPQSTVLQRLGSISRRTRRNRQSLLATDEASGLNGSTRHAPPGFQMSQQSVVTGQIPNGNHLDVPSTAPDAINHLSPAHPLPTPTVRFPEQSLQQYPTATVLGDDYLSYSVSQPNLLHIPQPYGNALEFTEEEAEVPERQRSFRRRVSTEPPTLPPPKNEAWRRRIEDWNEHTIRERSRKRRNKCIVM